jgi:hypothetical protein
VVWLETNAFRVANRLSIGACQHHGAALADGYECLHSLPSPLKEEKLMLTSSSRRILGIAAFIAVAAVAAPSFAEEVKVPQTAAEHEARAKSYKEHAVHYRSEAAEHKAMAAEYSQQHPDPKGGVKNPWSEKMRKHCLMLAADLDKLAVDAEKAAEYHTLRAKETQGG